MTDGNLNCLIGVVKNSLDLEAILKNKLYRMPVAQAPKKKVTYIAFYQPSSVREDKGLLKMQPPGFQGIIRYWARVRERTICRRSEILPLEINHSRAKEAYHVLRLGRIQRLLNPISNKRRMRVTFGFTTLKKLRSAREIKELFDIPPIEEMIERVLKETKILYKREHIVRLSSRKRYRLDFALFPDAGSQKAGLALALECDGARSHSRPDQKRRDCQKDTDLKNLGWLILRLSEKEIMGDLASCRQKIESMLVLLEERNVNT